ncbi:S-layer homology domain-containing protein [Paenibacillus silvae]|uniref:S-layer homology domain-containing protein n=1 Tax=Paenibacillus silvae TaxID=1325358 RepID=UPI0011A52D2B|nr:MULTISPECIES: S-layer homology domain-containing protein [Paenibacillus]MCK6077193.1 S-layer homology domain-containing protein [Paenibacillus silvae]MCK6151390.1 S-layer homology domain-containing protein [Paenibacillus silvae]MCK6269879.1 S-layer homology domain-containing protein [Paenibacillus silvae]
MKKNIIAAFTAGALLTLTLSAGPLHAAPAKFTDIQGVPGADKIESLHQEGLIKGVSDHLFKPEEQLNTAQGVQLIVDGLDLNLNAIRFIKMPVPSDYFKAVKDGVWYSDAFIRAQYNSIKLPQDIDPSKPMTREQYTVFLMQAIEAKGELPMIKIQPVDITDESDLTPDAQGAVQRSLVLKISTLDANGQFHPQQAITRAEAAVMMYNAIEHMNSFTTPQIPETPEK